MTRGKRLGQYELLDTIGQGEILTIYHAHHVETGQRVILKLIQAHLQDDQDLGARFRHRCQELLDLTHPNIVSARDASFDPGALYLVTDVPPGKSLAQRHMRQGPLEIDDALFIISQVAEALDYAHEQGVAHYDLRPENIYLTNQSAVLADFCVLEAVGATPTYMAPEQLDETSAQPPDRLSDAYSLGVIVYEMLTGRPPFEGAGADVAAAHLTQRPLAPRVHNPDLLPAVDAILLKALAKQRNSRYQTAGNFATTLHEAVQTAQTRRMGDDSLFDVDASTDTDVRYATSARGGGRIPIWAWVGLGILLVVVVAIVILLLTG